MLNKFKRTLRVASLVMLAVALAWPHSAVQAYGLSETQAFRRRVTLRGIREHQQALQAIADANGGTRASGGPGYDASAQYVYNRMVAAGYTVSYQEFTFPFVGDNTPPVFQQTAPTPRTYVNGVDYGTMQYSGSGDFTAPLWAVDLVVPPVGAANGNTSGCEAADFAGFPAGAIALIQRGTCTFRAKADNAKAAGAVAVVIFNEGQVGRTTGAFGTLNPPLFDRPVLSVSFAVGDELRNGVLNGSTGITVRVRADTVVATRTTRNVIAESIAGDPNRVIVIGAHLDGVTRGPGSNDNGSGSAAILEMAEEFARMGRAPRNKLRFMWYGAEEFGLLGSTFYVNSLGPAQRDQIELMLNFDMIGSPNYVRFIYDGDNSAFPVGPGAAQGPTGSGAIEDEFFVYFSTLGLATEPTPFSGRSDYGPFIAVGIPAGGLFTGAEGIKTEAQSYIFGGTAGEQYDPCYHLACDTYSNNSNAALDEMSDAAAHVMWRFAMRDFAIHPLIDPDCAGIPGPAPSGGGGLHEDEPTE
jgi:Zn-dependent M28 family amino/carboxypeptidase